MIICKSPTEIEKLRHSGRVVRELLEEICGQIRPGCTTWELEQYVESRLAQLKVRPAFKWYREYPCCLCA
jgi:methionyl aminopeptidase